MVLALRALAGCLLVVAPFAAFQYYGYLQFCSGPAYSATPQEWCYATLPNVYSFVQARYWGVGFLRYWQLQQVMQLLTTGHIQWQRGGPLVWAAVSSVAGHSIHALLPDSWQCVGCPATQPWACDQSDVFQKLCCMHLPQQRHLVVV